MGLKTHKKRLIWQAAICLVVASISYWFVAPKILQIDNDLEYTASIFSKDNLYSEKEKRFTGEIISKTTFKYGVDSLLKNGLLVKNIFDVRKPSGQKIFSVSRNYAIDPKNGKHIPTAGDKERTGYLFSPIPAPKHAYTYWHINYDTPIEMQFLESTLIEGLEVYHYMAKFKVDQSKELSFLPMVPETRGVSLDVQLELFVEPITGHLIKYQDQALAVYYNQASGEMLHPWNKFSNTYTFGSIIQQVYETNQKIFSWRIFRHFLPLIMLFICLVTIAYRWWKARSSKESNARPKFFAALIVTLGLTISIFVFLYLNRLDANSRVAQAELLSHNIWIEIQHQVEDNLETLNTLRFNLEINSDKQLELFTTIAQHALEKNGTIFGLSWIPKVEQSERLAFEAMQHSHFNDYSIKERNSNNDLVPAAERSFYFPVTYVQPIEQNKEAIGFDLASNTNRLATIRYADSIKDYAITPPIRLVQEKEDAKSILIMNPVFEPKANGELELQGLFNGVFRIPNLITQAIAYLDIPKGIGFKLIDVTDEKSELLYQYAIENETSPYTLTKTLTLSNRLWKLEMYTYPSFINQPKAANYFVLIIGIILTLASSWLFYREETDNRKEILQMNQNLIESKDRLRQYTAELKKSNQELEQFAYVASHDLQEPLRTINILTEMIYERQKEQLDEQSVQYFSRIKAGTKRMHQLIKGILEYSKVGDKVDKISVDLNKTLGGIRLDLKALIEDSKTEFQIDKLPTVIGNKTELQQLFTNLITNAIKFKKPNENCTIYLSSYETGTHFHFSLKDNGIGIAPKHFTKIFDIFQRLHGANEIKGTGIGLALCKKIVEIHGGKIWVVSEIGMGTTFHFTISKNS